MPKIVEIRPPGRHHYGFFRVGRRHQADHRRNEVGKGQYPVRQCDQRSVELAPSEARKPHLLGGLSPTALQRVQIFVEANLDRPLQLADLARRAELSRYHFARAFKTSAGRTPRAFIEQRRIERAKRLIRESTKSLAQIAVDTGFGTQSRLTSTFKRRTGFTPGEHRRGRRRSPQQ
jgi:transcriptional regulator GlxA family with amidase domain